MKKLTTITAILLAILALSCKGQEPDRHTYSDGLNKQMISDAIDSVNLVRDSREESLINSLNAIIQERELTISELESFKDSVLVIDGILEADSLELIIYDDRLSIDIKKEGYNIWLSIVDGDKRSYLWLLNDSIEMRLAEGNNQEQTWLPEKGIIHYK